MFDSTLEPKVYYLINLPKTLKTPIKKGFSPLDSPFLKVNVLLHLSYITKLNLGWAGWVWITEGIKLFYVVC